jgi:hypothetical protein
MNSEVMVPKNSQPFQGLGAARFVSCNARYHAAAHSRSDISLLNTYIEPPKTMDALLAFVCADNPGSSSNLSTISTFSLVTYSSPSEAGPKTCRGQMTRPQLILAVSIAGVIFALVWVLKMVLDRGRSILPSELPERPQKVSLLDRLSQKTSPSQPTLYGSASFSAPFPTNQPYLSAWAPSTSFTDDVIALTCSRDSRRLTPKIPLAHQLQQNVDRKVLKRSFLPPGARDLAKVRASALSHLTKSPRSAICATYRVFRLMFAESQSHQRLRTNSKTL